MCDAVTVCPLEGSPPCARHASRFLLLVSCCLSIEARFFGEQHGLILVLVGLGHLHYEFLCRSAPVSGATFPRATAPLSRASPGGKVYKQPPKTMGSRWKLRLFHSLLPLPKPYEIKKKNKKKMQKSVRYNEGHALFLSLVARKEGTKRGYLSKKTAENSRWHEKFFALYQNVLFYFENEQSARPAGIYLLEGCTCERAPAPKMSTTGKEALEKQVRGLTRAELRSAASQSSHIVFFYLMIQLPQITSFWCSHSLLWHNSKTPQGHISVT